jgi:CBS domain-containing protein
MPTVGEVMTRGVITIGEEESVALAMKTMVERHVSSIIVKKKDETDVYGIVTRKDIIHSVVGRNNDPKDIKVAELMTKPVMTITPSMDVVAAAKLMEKTKVRRFPVVENNVLVGLISNSDIFRAYVMDNVINKAAKKK